MLSIAAVLDDLLSQDQCDREALSAVRDNIADYSRINLVRALRETEGSPDEEIDEDQDAPVQFVYASDAVFEAARHQAVGERLFDRASFLPFQRAFNTRNAAMLCMAETGTVPTAGTLKGSLFQALNRLQRSSIPCAREAVVVAFDDADLLATMEREGLFDAPPEESCIAPAERPRIRAAIQDALSYILAIDPELHQSIVDQIGTIACFRRTGGSGSLSSLIGLIWLNPESDWSVVTYAENIVHEFIHNSIFLADLTQKIFTRPFYDVPPESLVVTALLKYPRSFNIAFHSLVVVVGLTILLRAANQRERADEVSEGLALTARELLARPEYLTDEGRYWLRDLEIVSG